MKIQSISSQIISCLIGLSVATFSNNTLNAQDDPVINYLQQTGDYADLYNGRLEAVYNIVRYKNFPYYFNSDYTEASIVYRNIIYPNQKVRIDLYKEQLILLPPEKKLGIIVNFQNIEKIMMYNQTFVRLIPPKDSGLKPGFYIQLLDKEKMKLYRKEYFDIQIEETIYYRFKNGIRFYLFYNNQYYSVKNKGSFSKLFPQNKKQINKFVKDHKLDFKQHPNESFTSLAGFCEELNNSNNK